MAQRLKFYHAIYDTFTFQRGSEQQFDESGKKVRELLQHGDGVLDRNEGFFFRHVKGAFVVAFESGRTDDVSREASKGSKKGEWYFDVFWTPIERVENKHIADVIEQLDAQCSDSYRANLDGSVVVKPQTYDKRQPEGSGGTDFDDGGLLATGESEEDSNEDGEDEFVYAGEEDADSATDTSDEQEEDETGVEPAGDNDRPRVSSPERGPDTKFLAQLWEQKRRDEVQVYAKVADIDRFNYAVEGALKQVDFVSTERKQNKTFDVVGGNFEYKIDASNLEKRLRKLRTDGRISVDRIPSYEEVLEQRVATHRSELREGDRFAGPIDGLVEEMQAEIESAIDTVEKRSAETFRRAYGGEWDDDNQESSLLTGVTSVVSSGGTHDDPAYVDELSSETVSEEALDRIVTEIVREEIDGSLRARREKILQRVDEDLQSLEERIRYELAQAVIDRIDDVRTSEVYERADNPE